MSREDLFTTVLELVREVGYDRLTMDAVAARAHVSKATIYRHWPGKADLVVAALQKCRVDIHEPVDTGSLRGDLKELLRAGAETCTEDMSLFNALAFAMQTNPELAQLVREQLLPAFRQPSEAAINRAIARGEIDSVAEIFHDLVPGLLMSRYVIHGLEVDEGYLDQIVDQVLVPVLQLR